MRRTPRARPRSPPSPRRAGSSPTEDARPVREGRRRVLDLARAARRSRWSSSSTGSTRASSAREPPAVDRAPGAAGNDVIYPRYENVPGGGPALLHSLIAIHAGLSRLARAHGGRRLLARRPARGRARSRRLADQWPTGGDERLPERAQPAAEEVVDFTRLPHAAGCCSSRGRRTRRGRPRAAPRLSAGTSRPSTFEPT